MPIAPWQMYRDLFYQTLATCRQAAPGKHKFRFNNKLLSMDSTTISLCLSLFPWRSFRRANGAIKLHLLEDHDGYLSTYAYLSNGKAIYKDRWQIEQFFKDLKQNLKVKTFVGTNENALYIQIWTALIAILLLKYLKFKSTLGWSLSNLLALLRWNLFTYRNICQWINNPYDVPPIEPRTFPIQGLGQHAAVQRG